MAILNRRTLRRWDLMRFLWRGKLRAHVRDVDYALGTTVDPEVSAASRRLQVLLCVMQIDRQWPDEYWTTHQLGA